MAERFRILVPVEFSPRCRGAVQYAEALARHSPSEILLLHVIPPPVAYLGSGETGNWYTGAEFARDREEERTRELAAFPCEPGKDCAVQRLVRQGDPATVIVETAAAERCRLIVMPTHGYGPFRRFLLGSVTAKVLHDAACPVWTGPHLENAPDPSHYTCRRILCGVDLGSHTRAVMHWAAAFAAEAGAELIVMHVVPLGTTRLGPPYFDPEWKRLVIHDAGERLDFLKRETGIRAETLVDAGEVGGVLDATARDRQADLMVMGRASCAHAHRRLPTQSYAIVRDAPCPVVAV